MKIKTGDELFVYLKISPNKPDRWDCAIVTKVTQKYFYLNYPPLRDKRIPLETMSVTGYRVFVPTEEDRQLRAETVLRSNLISALLRTDWGKLKTEALQELVATIEAFD